MTGWEDVDVAAGNLVLLARNRAGLSQAELARRAGVARPVVWAIEHGERQPSLPTLARVLRGAGFAVRLDLVVLEDSALRATSPALAAEREHALRVRDALELAGTIQRAKSRERPVTG